MNFAMVLKAITGFVVMLHDSFFSYPYIIVLELIIIPEFLQLNISPNAHCLLSGIIIKTHDPYSYRAREHWCRTINCVSCIFLKINREAYIILEKNTFHYCS